MPTLMSQNAVRPDNIQKSDPPGQEPSSAMDSSDDSIDTATPTATPATEGVSGQFNRNSMPQRSSLLPVIQTSLGYEWKRKSSSGESSSASPLSTPPTSSSSTNSPMSHIRRWTSSLTVTSKKQNADSSSAPKPTSRGHSKARTIGPISAPQPLTTPVPYACTPLPYTDPALSPTTPHSPLPPSNDTVPTIPRSPSKPAISCPDLSISAQTSDTSPPPSAYLQPTRNQRPGWKSRLFSSNAKKQDRRASTNSIVEDDYEWSAPDVDVPRTAAPPRTVGRPKSRVFPPSRPMPLSSSSKTIPVISAPLMSPTDDLFGPDSFDPFRIVPKTRATEDRLAQPSQSVNRSILDTLTPLNLTEMNAPSDEHRAHFDRRRSHTLPAVMERYRMPVIEDDPLKENMEGEVLDFAASLCKGLGTDFVMPPSYFDQNNLSLDFNERYPRQEHQKPPMVQRRQVSSAEDRASRTSSTYSISSDSSGDSEDSSSSSSSDSSSPISGASFFSTNPPATSVEHSRNKSIHGTTTLSSALLKSGGIKLPSSLMTLLPNVNSQPKEKMVPASPSTTPPITPPLEHCEAASMNQTLLGNASPGIIMAIADPRALTLKRLAYIHTLRKLRDRERRPFRHAVLLHLILVQLRRGVTNRQCKEIGDFYTAMSASQLSPQLNMASAMVLAHQQNQLRQQQQQTQSSPLPDLGLVGGGPAVPERSTSTIGHGLEGKDLKKRSLVFSIQSRIQSNKSQQGRVALAPTTGEGALRAAMDRPRLSALQQPTPTLYSPMAVSTAASSSSNPSGLGQFATLRERLPLLRIPAYPLINIDRKKQNGQVIPRRVSTEAVLPSTSTTSTTNDEPEKSLGDSESGSDEESTGRPTPTIIIPKRTTGRKGLLHQQQQLQLRQLQMESDLYLSRHQGQTEDPQEPSLDPTLLWSQSPFGARQSFATSTFTTIRTGPSEIITHPVVPPSEVKPFQNITNGRLFSSGQQYPTRLRPTRPPYRELSMMQSASGSSLSTTPSLGGSVLYRTPFPGGPIPEALIVDYGPSVPAPAGLLTPPLSPLFRSQGIEVTGVDSRSSGFNGMPHLLKPQPQQAQPLEQPQQASLPSMAATIAAGQHAATQEQPQQQQQQQHPNPPKSHSTPASPPRSFQVQAPAKLLRKREPSVPAPPSFAVPSSPPPSSSTPSGVVHSTISSHKLPSIQGSHHTISHLEGQVMSARNMNHSRVHSATLEGSNSNTTTATPKNETQAVGGSTTTTEEKDGLPSPPLSPTLDSDALTVIATASTATAVPSSSASSTSSTSSSSSSSIRSSSSASSASSASTPFSPPQKRTSLDSLRSSLSGGHGRSAQPPKSSSPAGPPPKMTNLTRHMSLPRRSSGGGGSKSDNIPWMYPRDGPQHAQHPHRIHPLHLPPNSSSTAGTKEEERSNRRSSQGAPEEEEDMPLAFVQRRLSTDLLRST